MNKKIAILVVVILIILLIIGIVLICKPKAPSETPHNGNIPYGESGEATVTDIYSRPEDFAEKIANISGDSIKAPEGMEVSDVNIYKINDQFSLLSFKLGNNSGDTIKRDAVLKISFLNEKGDPFCIIGGQIEQDSDFVSGDSAVVKTQFLDSFEDYSAIVVEVEK